MKVEAYWNGEKPPVTPEDRARALEFFLLQALPAVRTDLHEYFQEDEDED
jgi:hypothetical protein